MNIIKQIISAQRATVVCALSALGLLSACGGDAGLPQQSVTAAMVKAGGASAPALAPAPFLSALAGLDVQLTQLPASGQLPARAEVRVSDPASVAGLSALQGADYEHAAQLDVRRDADGGWLVMLPAGVEGGLLLRFQLANGDVLESAAGDFTLQPPGV